MKVTGIAIVCMGIAIGLFALVQLAAVGSTATEVANGTSTQESYFPPAFAFVVTVAALLIGGLLWAFGGKGTIETRNPAVRN